MRENTSVASPKISSLQLNTLRTIAHELKTPLIHIQGTSRLLLEGVDDPAIAHEHLQRLELSAERMLRIVDAYIYTQQLATNQRVLALTPFNIGSIAHEVVADLQSLALRYNTHINLRVGKRLQPAAVDSMALRHMLYGIFDAAIRTSKSEVIEISITQKAERAILIIQDDGAPIPTGVVANLAKNISNQFQPSKFLASDISTSVFIAHMLCEAMYGNAIMQHRKGKRQFSFHFPLSSQMELPL